MFLSAAARAAAASCYACRVARNASVAGDGAILIAHHHQPVVARLATPQFAGAAVHLAHARAALVAREGLEFLTDGVEALDGIGEPVGRPYVVLVVNVNRVSAGRAL